MVSGRGFDTKDVFQKRKVGEAQRRERNDGAKRLPGHRGGGGGGEEEAKSEGKLPHSYTHTHTHTHTQQGNPRSIQKTICGLKWMSVVCVCACVFKTFSVLILVPPEQAEQRGEEGRRRGRQA